MAKVFLTSATVAAAQSRSRAQAQANGCDGVNTVYWWPVGGGTTHAAGFSPPTALQAVLGIDNASAFYGTQGLSGGEQSALQTAAQLATAGWTVPS